MSLKQSFLLIIGAVIACSGSLATATPFTNKFDPIIVELELREGALSNSVDKTEQKQFKVVVKDLALLDDLSGVLADDLKTAGKLAKSLLKTFPDDFISAPTASPILIPSNSFATLLSDLLTDFQNDVQQAMNDLQGVIDGLPPGSAHDKAAAALAQAQALFSQVSGANGFVTAFKSLGSVMKSVAKGQKAAASGGGGGGGGGGGNSMTADIIINGVTDNWVADNNGAEIVISTGALDVSGSRTSPSGFLSVPVNTNFTGAGTYSLGNGVGSYSAGGAFYLSTTGTLNIATFDTNTLVTTGTFWFDASDGSTNIVVTNGTFSVTNLTVTP